VACLVIGHRGAASASPENSLLAFQAAVDQGADGVELDVRRTADGAMAIVHDEALPDGRLVVETRLAELPEHVPVLAEVLDTCRTLQVVNIEIKNWPADADFDESLTLASEVVGLLESRGDLGTGRMLVSCFHRPTVDLVHELAPGLPTALLLGFGGEPHELVQKAAERGHVAVHPHFALVDEVFVRVAHDVGLAVNVWTVDEPDAIRRLAEMGVDGIVTNVPDIALEALGR